jgi:hypothetical protein
MKRLLTFPVLALLTLTACDDNSITSSLEPELAEPAFDQAKLPLEQPLPECPVANCLLGPESLVRETRAPTLETLTFAAAEGQTATLVFQATNPKTTTLRAWLNGVLVILPSQLPRSGSDEVRVPVELLAENVLTVRLSAKPGTQVFVWVEGDGNSQNGSGSGGEVQFQLTSPQVFAPAPNLNEACTMLGEGFGIADWTDVVQAVEAGTSKEEILAEGYAFILYQGDGFLPGGFGFPDEHYALSASEPGLNGDPSIGTDMFWLVTRSFELPVLCIGPADETD